MVGLFDLVSEGEKGQKVEKILITENLWWDIKTRVMVWRPTIIKYSKSSRENMQIKTGQQLQKVIFFCLFSKLICMDLYGL